MGLLNKFKNMFTEEIEEVEEEPIKKEVISVEIPAPTPKIASPLKEEKRQPEHKETIKKQGSPILREEKEEKPKEDEKFTFPVFFDDDDFDSLDHKPASREEKKTPYQGKKKTVKEETKKKFKPTPVISPIYGVLDKNYKKEDITSRKGTVSYKPSKEMNVDDIRKKAYGTLEDELESGLLNDPIYDKPAVFKDEADMFEDFNFFEDMEEELSRTKQKRLKEMKEEEKVEKRVEQKPKEEKKEEILEDENDLFHLIDSMYEKGEDQ